MKNSERKNAERVKITPGGSDLPHDWETERTLLSSLLMDYRFLDDIRYRVNDTDFARQDHAETYRMIKKITDSAGMCDIALLLDYATRDGIEKFGGASHILGLANAAPTPEFAPAYADRVHELACIRRTVLGVKGVIEVVRNGASFREMVAELERVTTDAGGSSLSTDAAWSHLIEGVDEAYEETRKAYETGESPPYLRTGISELDEHLNAGPGDLVVVAARPAMGKAQPVDCNVLTPSGFVKIGSLRVGDKVIGSNGKPTTVLGVYPQGVKKVYRVKMSDGGETRCCDEHLWFTQTIRELNRGCAGSVKSLARIRMSVRAEGMGWFNHRIPTLPDWDGTFRYISTIVRDGEAECVCIAVDAPDHLYVTDDFIITHNTVYADQWAGHVAKHYGSVGFFSLEMPKRQIGQRNLARQSGVGLKAITDGRNILRHEIEDLVRARNDLTDLSLFVDDLPSLSPATLKMKVRALKRKLENEVRPALVMVVIDYLQLADVEDSGSDNRTVAIGRFTRMCKVLARDENIVVVLVSQLNRSLESRTNKRPIPSDLRDSGCLVGDTLITRADNGREVRIGDLVKSGERDFDVWAMDDRWRLVRGRLTNAFSTGVKPVFRLVTASGRVIRATANHKFRREWGWARLDELGAWDRIAVPADVRRPDSRVTLDFIIDISPDGEEEVFDATVDVHHNFVANNIIVHNSIEQDADSILFIYRDEVYDPASADKGMAEIIIAKQRQGSLATAKVSFNGSVSRFGSATQTGATRMVGNG